MLKKLNMKFFKFSFLLFLSSCAINKIDVLAYKESNFNTPKRVFIIANAVGDEDLNEFQTKLCYLLNYKMVKNQIKSDYYIAKYKKNETDLTGMAKLKDFKPDYYFEISPITDQSLIMVRDDGFIARQGSIYEIVLKDFSNGTIVYRMKLSAGSMISASNGAKKAANKLWNRLRTDKII